MAVRGVQRRRSAAKFASFWRWTWCGLTWSRGRKHRAALVTARAKSTRSSSWLSTGETLYSNGSCTKTRMGRRYGLMCQNVTYCNFGCSR
jgi:hypothetical protein